MSNIIQVGIDLGTTNSAIVANINGKYEVVKNSDQMDYTPSVFGYNKGKNIQVGKKAYDQLFQLPDDENVKNYKAEIKRLMGTNEKTRFSRVDSEMSPEEISAEIIKYLKETLTRKYPEINTDGVVITVPAYFDTIQKEATKKAGELGGFKHVVLIQEPIAGALAYGFENKNNENRLVYDLGGGTFDVAVVSSKDGVLTIKGHAGDNYLGGKDFDNIIVSKIIMPILEEKGLTIDVITDSIKNQLKSFAEIAKKNLTDFREENINIVLTGQKDKYGNLVDIDLNIQLTREVFDELIGTFVWKSIDLCKNAIKESGLSNEDINRIILVGGPTQIPYIREILENELGIKCDASMDPLTVVAKGACIFGSSQIIPEDKSSIEVQEPRIGSVKIKLNYEPVVSDDDTTITGIIEGLSELCECYIQIQSNDGKYSSSKIKLKNGKFFDTLLVSEGKRNIYYIYVTDTNGNIITTDVDSFSIMHGLSIAGTPLSHSVSVALNKKIYLGDQTEEYCEKIFERGAILPLNKTITVRTSRALKKGDENNVLPIKIYEGESKKTDRNKQICEVKVLGTEIPYNLPEGTEVNLTIEINVSNELSVSIYFPCIDLLKSGKSMRTEGEQEIIDSNQMRQDLEIENNRLDDLSDHIPEQTTLELKNIIKELYNQSTDKDSNSKRKTYSEIKELKQKMDKYELETESSRLIQQFHYEVEQAEDLFQENENPLEFKQFISLKIDGEKAISNNDWERLETVIEDVNSIRTASVLYTPEGMKYMLGLLYEKRHKSSDPIKSNEIFNRCIQYVEVNDIEGMRQCIREILALMPQDVQNNMTNISGITK